MKKNLIPCLKKSERGASLIEFAIVGPILILLVLGIVEFGWMFNGWVTITGAAREGARIASVLRVFDDYAYIKEVVKNHATPTFSESRIDVDVKTGSDNPSGVSASEYIVVEAKGELDPLIGFFIRNPQTLSGVATMRTD